MATGYCFKMMIIFFILIELCSEASLATGREVMSYKQDGDFVIGALLALRGFDEKSQTCTNITDLGGIKRAQSIVYTVTKINKDPNILTNVTLGYEIFDTCYTRSMALKHARSFTKTYREKTCREKTYREKTYRERDNVVGVVGASLSSTSEISTILLSLYNITMISHLATSDELGNRERYPFFMRTIPPDSLQVDTVIDILEFYEWKYVAFIYTESIYGRQAYDTFRRRIKDKDLGICIPYERSMTVSDGEAVFNDTVDQLENLRKRSLLSVVIIFAELENIEGLLRTANNKKVWRKFIWIGSDSFGIPCLNTVKNVEEVALGAFTIIPKAIRSREFEHHFEKELQKNQSSNPWIKEYKPGSSSCPSFESLLMDAVEWLARGLDELLKRKCGKDMNVSCNRKSLLEGNRNYLRDILLNASFNSYSNGTVFFRENDSPLGLYEIRQLIEEDGSYKYKSVGNWTSKQKLTMNEGITWYLTNQSRFSNTGIPRSSCREPCPSHQRRVLSEDEPCCWTCENCDDDQIVVMNGTLCKSCIDKDHGIYTWPSRDKQTCMELPNLAILKQANAIAIISVSLLGIVFTSLVAYLYVLNREKRIIKASSRELGYVILIGVFFNYLAAILYRTRATIFTCSCRRVISHVATSFMYVSIATITIRLYRIFMAGRKSAQRPQFISPKSQIIVTLSLSLIPFTWAITWMIIKPPSLITLVPTQEQQFIHQICYSSFPHMAGQLVWKLTVLLVCCVFAFRARHLPANYNQSRFIAFCVFGALIVDIAFAPALFSSSSSDSANLGIYLSLGAIIHSSVVIILIFAVRIYAVYFVDLTEPSQQSTQQSHSTSNVQPTQGTNKISGKDTVDAVDEPTSKSTVFCEYISIE
ncbi:Metabotropic glutamate receptor 8 [Holothuria leucospilota]|uniref:Metabotropic glutamate receptor 8 n=1 Tax=Holothuria leucospilota TaxID=206669 RepID=A0A9Q1BHH9_HOLLE|nr:Metabotropic glutamate receptor 8 [Holothuria leucospilota]